MITVELSLKITKQLVQNAGDQLLVSACYHEHVNPKVKVLQLDMLRWNLTIACMYV